MRIMHLLQSPFFSGAENVVCQIIGMFKNDKTIEMVYCSQEGQIREALDERDIKFVPLLNFTISDVKEAITKQKPDLIHAHDMRASLYASIVCGNIPIVSHIHNNSFDSRVISLKSIAYLYAAKKARHIFWVSDSSYQGYLFHSIIKNKSSILYNIIDTDKLFQKMKNDTNNYDYDVVYLGRISAPKNPRRLLQVFKILVEKKPEIRIAVIGTGEMEKEIQQLASELQLTSNVEFLGFHSNPYKILYDAKVMVMTSSNEGTPMCILEAQALGVPVVSTPVGGVCEIITNGHNGYLSDSDTVLAKSIINLVNNTSLRNEMKKNAKKKMAEMMNKDKYMSELKKAYGI